jgi:hypothetical protein
MQRVDQLIEDLQRNARAADREDKERAQLFRGMIASPAWKAFIALLEVKLQLHADIMMAPALSVDGMVAREYVKGAMSGLVLARDLPSIIIDAMDKLRQEQRATGYGDDDDV